MGVDNEDEEDFDMDENDEDDENCTLVLSTDTTSICGTEHFILFR